MGTAAVLLPDDGTETARWDLINIPFGREAFVLRDVEIVPNTPRGQHKTISALAGGPLEVHVELRLVLAHDSALPPPRRRI